MSESDREALTSISRVATPEEIGEFWDSHSLADHGRDSHEVSFEVRARRRRRITLDPELYNRLETEALIRGISPETLVNRRVTEKLLAP